MKVMFAPFYEGNQYQELLAEELSEADVSVLGERANVPFAPILLEVLLFRVDVLHVHWTHPYFLFGSKRSLYSVPGNEWICRLAAVVFLLQVWVATFVCDAVVWTVHNRCNHEKQYESLDKWVGRTLLGLVDTVQVWDERTRDELISYLGEPSGDIVQIPHGNYLPVYEDVKMPSKEDAREELGVSGYNRVYLYFGIIRPYKQVPKLIETFQSAQTDACLVVAGNPKYDDLRNRIETLASDDDSVCTQLEYIPDESVPTYFAAADAVIFPYSHIFNSGSVILAMSLGRAFVAPRSGSIPSVSPPGNILYDELAEGFEEVESKSDADLGAVGAENRRVADAKFDWRDVRESHIRMYRRASTAELGD